MSKRSKKRRSRAAATPSMTKEQAKRAFKAKCTSSAIRGGFFAAGVAACELVISAGAAVAGPAIAAAETAVILPTVATVAAVGATVVGGVVIYKKVTKN